MPFSVKLGNRYHHSTTSLEYANWRKDVLERDKFTCKECSSKVSVVAHHIKPWTDFPENRFDVNNGKTLCQECHKKEHPYMKNTISRGYQYR